MKSTKDKFLTYEEAAEYFSCSKSTIKRRVQSGQLKVSKDLGERLPRVIITDFVRRMGVY